MKENKQNNLMKQMRIWHRYLGFFLAGIMAVYALSGVLLIFRDTPLLRQEKEVVRQLSPNLSPAELREALRMKKFKMEKHEGDVFYFNAGQYNAATGEAQYKVESYPFVLEKMVHLHKASSSSPLFFLNIFFGVALLFFSISAFFMFKPKSEIFKKGSWYAVAGIALTLLLLFL